MPTNHVFRCYIYPLLEQIPGRQGGTGRQPGSGPLLWTGLGDACQHLLLQVERGLPVEALVLCLHVSEAREVIGVHKREVDLGSQALHHHQCTQLASSQHPKGITQCSSQTHLDQEGKAQLEPPPKDTFSWFLTTLKHHRQTKTYYRRKSFGKFPSQASQRDTYKLQALVAGDGEVLHHVGGAVGTGHQHILHTGRLYCRG